MDMSYQVQNAKLGASEKQIWMLCCRRRPLLELEDSGATEQRWKRSFRQTNKIMDVLLLGQREAAL